MSDLTTPESITCKHCGCALHLSSTITGFIYWASNSGNSRCVWPMQHMTHEAVIS